MVVNSINRLRIDLLGNINTIKTRAIDLRSSRGLPITSNNNKSDTTHREIHNINKAIAIDLRSSIASKDTSSKGVTSTNPLIEAKAILINVLALSKALLHNVKVSTSEPWANHRGQTDSPLANNPQE